jgi:putative PEP-CTERM system histidine kinase
MFGALLVWRLTLTPRHSGSRLLLGAFALTACWAWIAAIAPDTPLAGFAETARNLVWVGLLHSLYTGRDGDQRDHGVKPVYAAVSAVLGLQLIVTGILLTGANPAVEQTALILRITAAAGSLVLVHNLYGQAAPASRPAIRFTMLALALNWIYDLNFYTVAYLDPPFATAFGEWRGGIVALTAPLFALGARNDSDWRIRLSRAATFQSLSLLAICAYFAVMAILATALRDTDLDWPRTVAAAALAVMTVAAMVLLPSPRARAWAKVKLAKHLFEHRYDYRSEWLRFTDTLGGTTATARPLGERVIQAFANILDCPGGLLLEADGEGFTTGATWEWTGPSLSGADMISVEAFCHSATQNGRIVEFDAIRSGVARAEEKALDAPEWILANRSVHFGIPLQHQDKIVGFLLLAAPDYRRPLDWEDFDLLRTAARQAASSLAEAQSQRALLDVRRFEEFNRRFAFILHDVKNLVSQLTLLARNAERHADNPEFRSDMIATLKGSVTKLNDLLSRLAPQSGVRQSKVEPNAVRDIVASVIAARRTVHEIRLLGNSTLILLADAAALEQAIGHLLQNAVDASDAEEPVTVRIRKQGDQAAISISDKGCGMDPDFVRDALFKPFVSTKDNGFGIGAFEARALVTGMGGQLQVETARGAGTTFTILLPLAGQPASAQRKVA